MESSDSTCLIDKYYRENKDSSYLFGIVSRSNLKDLNIENIVNKEISICFHVKLCQKTKLSTCKNFFEKPGEYLIILITEDMVGHYIYKNKKLQSTITQNSLLIVNLNYFSGTDFEEKVKNFSIKTFFDKLKNVFGLNFVSKNDID